jgi:hypothetical protein
VTWWRSCGPTMGVFGSLSKVGVRSRCHLNYSAVASPNAHEALIGCDQRGRRVRQLASPQRDTGAPPLSARWHALSSTHPTPEHRRVMAMHAYITAYQQPRFQRFI